MVLMCVFKGSGKTNCEFEEFMHQKVDKGDRENSARR